ncbi:hypothetical protein ABT330_17835 [Streptomyces sp. NPDC000658]|uniref:hypothetical protein n=1 Tax=Streptomyces sp. NPDC000658 TaxID=3154266 RepID=UPI00332E0E87
MGSWKITVCAGAAVLAAVLVPTGHASGGGRDAAGRGGGGLSVTPVRPSPGSEVTLRATGCGGRTATAASAAFVTDARLVVEDGADGVLVGDTRVRSSLAPGGYDVRITCADGRVKGRIEVLKPASAASDDPSAPAPADVLTAPSPPAALTDAAAPVVPSSPPPAISPVSPVPATPLVPPAVPASPTVPASAAPLAVPASPVAPVRAGGGGTAPMASVEEVRADGDGPGTVQGVVGLVLAGVTAAVVVFRGLRRRPGTD